MLTVEKTEGVRLAIGDTEIRNPKTNETISIPNSGGDAEVFYVTQQEWVRVYSWSSGLIAFKGLPSFERSDDPARITARRLAQALNAKIVGSEGEEYN